MSDAADVLSLPDGTRMDSQLRVGGILYLESKLGVSFLKIGERFIENPSMTDCAALLAAAILQQNSGMQKSEAEQKVQALTVDELTDLFSKIRFSVTSLKNPQTPVRLTETQPP